MEDIKRRVELIRAVLEGLLTFPDENSAYEFVSLQLRKCLERIAFASLVANRDAYAEAWKNYRRHWSATRLFENLEKLHPDFYPQAVSVTSTPGAIVKELTPLSDGYLEREEFIQLYDLCSQVIHSWNPFRVDEPLIDFEMPVAEWIQRLQTLLGLHVIRLAGSPELWLVYMKYPPDDRVHALVASPM